jgi:hypothetical protein
MSRVLTPPRIAENFGDNINGLSAEVMQPKGESYEGLEEPQFRSGGVKYSSKVRRVPEPLNFSVLKS